MHYRTTPQKGFNFGELIIDNFAGGGGASTGIEMAVGRPVDIAINHDPAAIRMHTVNHPTTRHYNENVWDINPREVTHGQPVGLAWFSPDCRHFSKAKGGKPVSKQVRGLAWVVLRWAATVRPRVIMLENVEEFLTWGPLVENDKGQLVPCPKRKGKTFQSFKRALERHGYNVEFKPLRACDYGAPTIRKRLFLIARCDGLPIVWPAPTHGPGKKPYRTAAEIIDWSLPCPSIFERKRPLADATLRRIAEGIRRYVLECSEPFIVTYYGAKQGEKFRGLGINNALPTQTTENRFALVSPIIAGCGGRAGQSRPRSIDEPFATVTAKADSCLVVPYLARQFGKSVGHAATQPAGTVTSGGGGKTQLVQAFLAKHYGGVVGHKPDQPLGTVTQQDHHSVVTAHLTEFANASHQRNFNVDEPLRTQCANTKGGHFALVQSFLIKYFTTGKNCPPVSDPLSTISTKDRLGLVTVHGVDYQIVDIGMRMLQPHELYAAQGFPANYVFDRDGEGKPFTKTEQIAKCGNSVCPPVVEALVRANYCAMEERKDAAI